MSTFKFIGIDGIQSMFSEHNLIRQETNNKKEFGKFTYWQVKQHTSKSKLLSQRINHNFMVCS